jgi:phosphate transport system substrate-binding protein
LRQSSGGPNAGSASLKAEATQLLNSYRELEGVVESLQDQVGSPGSTESERVVQLSDGIRQSEGRAQKLLASNPSRVSEGIDTSGLETLESSLAQVGNSLAALVPTPKSPFPPSSATMLIAAPADLTESLLVPLLNSWAGKDAVLTAGEAYYLDAPARGEKIVIKSMDEEAGRQALANGAIDLLISDMPGGEDAELSRSMAEVIALNAVTLLVHPDNRLEVLKSDQNKVGFVVGPEPAITRNAGRFGLDASEKTERSPVDEALNNKDSVVLSLYNLDGTGNLRAKRLAVQASPLAPELKPSPFSIATEDYAYSFRIIAFNPSQPKTRVLEFVRHVTSDEGQAVVQRQGYVDLRLRPEQGSVDPQILAVLGEALGVNKVQSATRLSTNLRFATGKSDLDLKARADMERLPKYIAREYPTHKVVILGFTDSTGSPERHDPLSKERAAEVTAELQKFKIESRAAGLGMGFPVDTNETEAGRTKNRRAEVWVVMP